MSRARPPFVYPLAAAAAVATVAVVLLLEIGGGRRAVVRVHAHLSVRLVSEAPDPLADKSFALPAGSIHHARARAPRAAAREAFLSPGAPTDQQVIQELQQEQAIAESDSSGVPRVVVDPADGEAIPPPGLPAQVQEVIAGGNAIRDFPYVYGGGHLSFVDDAYDCSGSVSYALAAGGLIAGPETSGQLENWGKPGVGRYITVFANAGHTFMWVDGVWFDTAGRAGPFTTRWLTVQPALVGYAVRHYPGL
jgi:cell wall-associated NlpC family hydrolase